jgi:RND family efflux transporter MFP subunit
MTTIQFLADWALRSSILILSGALLLRALLVKDPSIRLAAWTAMLFGSLAIPALSAVLPKVSLAVIRMAVQPVKEPLIVHHAAGTPMRPVFGQNEGSSKQRDNGITRFDWAGAGVTLYVLVAFALLLRLCLGMAMSLRLLRTSRATGKATEGIEIRESDRVTAPLTLGIGRMAIVLPRDWRQWSGVKLDAVLAHERSHIRRFDPGVQLLSAIHRVLLWYSPLTWFLHKRIVRVAEEASDDAAVAVIQDRVRYAEVLLEFMQLGVRSANLLGVPMARYGRPDERIHRILEGTSLSHGVTRLSVAVILAIGSPLAYVVAAAHPHSELQAQAEISPVLPVQTTTGKPPASDASKPQSAAEAKRKPVPLDLDALGAVAAFNTVIVRPRVDGQLLSVSFKEGDLVQTGQLLASLDPRPYQIQLSQAQGQLAQDQAQLADARRAQNETPKQQLDTQVATVAQLEGKMKSDQASVDNAKLQLTYAQVTAPISGVAGLRLIDPGNIVHSADATGILVITQVRPIAVLFNIREEFVVQVRSRLWEGANLLAEAWNRTHTIKIATGRVTAVDNQIDTVTGTGKVKAVFDNKDGALFPNQFVNVHILEYSK